MDSLSRENYFTKIDLKSGYHHIRIRGDEWKISFKTNEGLHEWLVMHFGLTKALSTFMRLMNEVLKKILGKFVIVYLDDILIFSKSKEELLEHIRQVLQRLKEEKLLINLKKFPFMKEEIVYLGFVISANGLKMDLKKVRVILDWPTPENVGEVRLFHGLAKFYMKFIINFNSICNAMVETMRADKRDFRWTHEAYNSFETLKQRIIELPTLALPDFSNVFQVECDASGSAIGVVLSQVGSSWFSILIKELGL